MKLSVSLPDDDVALLDENARTSGRSRSAVLHQAVGLLRRAGLAADYGAAFQEWDCSTDREVWDSTAGDGMS